MKTAKALAREALKLQAKIQKAESEVRAKEHSLAYRREEYAKLPAELEEARADYREAQNKVTETLAELTKPLDRYQYNARYYGRNHEGPRRYSSHAAQAAWEAERQFGWKEGRVQALEGWIAQTLDQFTAEQREDTDAAWANWQNLDALYNATLDSIRAIMGPQFDLSSLAESPAPKETPDEVTIPAARTDRGFRVLACNLAKLPGKSISFAGLLFYADQIKAWAKLEAENVIEFIYDEAYGAIRLISPTSRACFKSQGDKPAPALVFAS